MDYTNDRLMFCQRLAVLGGTFDPIHNGHLAVAEAVLEAYKPNRVLFVPVGNPPHKKNAITPFEHRYQMALQATADHPRFSVTRLESERGGLSYTVDTIKKLREICEPGTDIHFIVGGDTLLDILTWKDVKELLSLCHFVVIPRPGGDKKALKKHMSALRDTYGGQLDLLKIKTPPVSGTDIRARMAAGQSVRYMLPRAVEDYARQHALYHSAMFSFEDCKQKLKMVLSPRRYTHTLGVVEEAERLAKCYGADITKARVAALLHDCAKEYELDKKRTLCALWNIPLDDILEAQLDLTHALLGAEAARRDYGVNDEETLQAIRYHIAGHKDMTMLDKIIVLADYIEPTREDYPGLREVRALAYTDINAALVTGIKATIADNTERGRRIHPWSYDAVNTLKN